VPAAEAERQPDHKEETWFSKRKNAYVQFGWQGDCCRCAGRNASKVERKSHVEPKYIHVSSHDFEQTVSNAVEIGFEKLEYLKIFLSRVVVLRKG